MTKHAKKSNHLQAVDLPKTMAVEIPLPLLGAFTDIERSFFELCIDAGQQVLGAMMEQDREDLCGPRWKRDPLDRHALNAVACGISSQKYARSLDPLPEEMDERSTSKSSVSRRYVAMAAKQLASCLTTPIGDRDFPIVMIDGIPLGDHLVLIALSAR